MAACVCFVVTALRVEIIFSQNDILPREFGKVIGYCLVLEAKCNWNDLMS